jgi:hypothetical protein
MKGQKRKKEGATSSYTGVSKQGSKAKPWHMRISHGGKCFQTAHATEEEAARAWDRECLRLRGSKAELNFPLDPTAEAEPSRVGVREASSPPATSQGDTLGPPAVVTAPPPQGNALSDRWCYRPYEDAPVEVLSLREMRKYEVAWSEESNYNTLRIWREGESEDKGCLLTELFARKVTKKVST